jgi:cell division protein FtsI (penicillin-binding protein 3)
VASHTVSTKRRIVFAVAAVIVVVAVFVVRLVDIQLVRADALVSDSLTKTTANGTIYARRDPRH